MGGDVCDAFSKRASRGGVSVMKSKKERLLKKIEFDQWESAMKSKKERLLKKERV